MELKKLSDKVFYIPNATNIGVIVQNSRAILIDSGLDDDTGKKVLQLLEKAGLSLNAIVNTHSHADHIGGNSYLAARTGAKLYAPAFEASVIEYPYFEPFFLFSGAHPIKDLRNKFLMAKPSKVDFTISPQAERIDIGGVSINVVPLPGHALNQIGIEYDGIFFCADSIFSGDVLKKHKIPFCVDIQLQKETLDKLAQSSYSLFVPSHAEPSGNIASFIDEYKATITRLENSLYEMSAEPKSTEELLARLCSSLGITIKNPQQYYLLSTSVMAYMSCMHEQGRLKVQIDSNRLLWQSA